MICSVVSNLLGWSSIACSLSFWIILALSRVPFLAHLDLTFNQFCVVWGVGIVLAISAALLGRRRWAWAALLPVINFLGFIFFVNLPEIRL